MYKIEIIYVKVTLVLLNFWSLHTGYFYMFITPIRLGNFITFTTTDIKNFLNCSCFAITRVY